jgi:hypothetical protein
MHIVDAGAIWPLVRLLRQCHEAVAASENKEEGSGGSQHASSCKEAIACLLQNIGHYELRQVRQYACL